MVDRGRKAFTQELGEAGARSRSKHSESGVLKSHCETLRRVVTLNAGGLREPSWLSQRDRQAAPEAWVCHTGLAAGTGDALLWRGG